MDKRLPRWFCNRLTTIMEHNNYTQDMLTTTICTEKGYWTPVDLILREKYNNGCGSAQGFLGITPRECERCYKFIKENQQLLKELDYYNECGKNNYGFTLWTNWEVH